VIDLGISKLALIGAVALVVIGPERLPGVARTIGTLIGKAQRYVSDVKAEVNRSMELDALKKAKAEVEAAANNVAQTVHTSAADFEKDWAETTAGLSDPFTQSMLSGSYSPEYRNPNKNWRLKRGAVPHWYKVRQGVRTKAQSGAARVARFRPAVKRLNHV
jgi:sec-independent protein translocase protein TatB